MPTKYDSDYFLTPNAKRFWRISARLLREKSFEMLRLLEKSFMKDNTNLSWGDRGCKRIYERIKMGATLVQIYSMLIYHGPDMIRKS